MVSATSALRAPPRRDENSFLPGLASSLVLLLESARSEMDGDRDAAKASIARASALLRGELDRQATNAGDEIGSGQLAPWQIRRIKAYIDERLDQTIHIKDLAEVAKRSIAYFCRAFKRTFGETPHTYIIGCRLERARFLMLTTEMALSAVALNCGFADQAHLCRLFRQTDGLSPAVWRRQRRDDHVVNTASGSTPLLPGEMMVGAGAQGAVWFDPDVHSTSLNAASPS